MRRITTAGVAILMCSLMAAPAVGQEETSPFAAPVTAARGMVQDPDGRVWIADSERGFCRLRDGAPQQIDSQTCIGGASGPGSPRAPGAPAGIDLDATRPGVELVLVPDSSAPLVVRLRWDSAARAFVPAGELTILDQTVRPTAVAAGPGGSAYVVAENARTVLRIDEPSAEQPRMMTVGFTAAEGARAVHVWGQAVPRVLAAEAGSVTTLSVPSTGARGIGQAQPFLPVAQSSALAAPPGSTEVFIGTRGRGPGADVVARADLVTGSVDRSWLSGLTNVTGLAWLDGLLVATDANPSVPESGSIDRVATASVGPSPHATRLDFNGDGAADVLARDGSGRLWLYPGNGRGGWQQWSQVGNGWSRLTMVAPGDFNGDGAVDVLARDDGSGRLWLYPGNGRGGWLPQSQVGTGWSGLTIVAPGDFNGDGAVDVLARDSSGRLWLYPGNGRGGWLAPFQVGSGWSGLTIVAPGDFNGDGAVDVLARDSSGRLWLYPGNGRGGWLPQSQVGTGWSGLTIVAPGDFNGDGAVDVLARDGVGRLWLYPGDGGGGWLSRSQVGNGWSGFTALLP